MEIFVVRVEMPTSERTEYTKMIDEDTKEIKYAFSKTKRLKIERIRNKYKGMLHNITLNFYGLQLINKDKIDEIKKIVEEANKEFAEIDSSLIAKFITLPVSNEAIEKGELYSKIVYAIQYQIAKEVFNRIKDLKSDTPREVTKESIREMLESMKGINIVNDRRIDQWIDQITKMLDRRTEEIRKNIMEELEYLEEMLASV